MGVSSKPTTCGAGGGEATSAPPALAQVIAQPTADQAARDRLQHLLAPALGLLDPLAGLRVGGEELALRGRFVQRRGNGAGSLKARPIGPSQRRHGGASEAQGPQDRRVKAAGQRDLAVLEALLLEHAHGAQRRV